MSIEARYPPWHLALPSRTLVAARGRQIATTLARSGSWCWRRIERHMMGKAASLTRPYLALMSDDDLARLGHHPSEIRDIRAAAARDL